MDADTKKKKAGQTFSVTYLFSQVSVHNYSIYI